MGSWTDVGNTVCPIARSLAEVGDRWTMLILRELFMDNNRFEEIQAQTEASSQMLAMRLKRLEADGLVARHPYSKRPLRHEYRLTEKGRAFYPVILALRSWGETWCKADHEGIAVRLTHRKCGHDIGLQAACPSCGETVERQDLDAELSPSFAEERGKRHAAFKSRNE